MNSMRSLLPIFVALVLALGSTGCPKSEPSSSAGSGGASAAGGGSGAGGGNGSSAKLSGMDKEAADVVMAEVQKRWAKTGDGWVTARHLNTDFAPIKVVREVKQINVKDVDPQELGESDRMNGMEWAGEVTFERSPAREAGEPGMAFDGLAGMKIQRGRGHWSQWVDLDIEAVKVRRVKGKWIVTDDTWLLRGAQPTPADFAEAGVK